MLYTPCSSTDSNSIGSSTAATRHQVIKRRRISSKRSPQLISLKTVLKKQRCVIRKDVRKKGLRAVNLSSHHQSDLLPFRHPIENESIQFHYDSSNDESSNSVREFTNSDSHSERGLVTFDEERVKVVRQHLTKSNLIHHSHSYQRIQKESSLYPDQKIESRFLQRSSQLAEKPHEPLHSSDSPFVEQDGMGGHQVCRREFDGTLIFSNSPKSPIIYSSPKQSIECSSRLTSLTTSPRSVHSAVSSQRPNGSSEVPTAPKSVLQRMEKTEENSKEANEQISPQLNNSTDDDMPTHYQNPVDSHLSLPVSRSHSRTEVHPMENVDTNSGQYNNSNDSSDHEGVTSFSGNSEDDHEEELSATTFTPIDISVNTTTQNREMEISNVSEGGRRRESHSTSEHPSSEQHRSSEDQNSHPVIQQLDQFIALENNSSLKTSSSKRETSRKTTLPTVLVDAKSKIILYDLIVIYHFEITILSSSFLYALFLVFQNRIDTAYQMFYLH